MVKFKLAFCSSINNITRNFQIEKKDISEEDQLNHDDYEAKNYRQQVMMLRTITQIMALTSYMDIDKNIQNKETKEIIPKRIFKYFEHVEAKV